MFLCGIVVGYLSFLLPGTIDGLSIPLNKDATAENIRVTFQAYEEDRVRRDTDGVSGIDTFLPETTVAQLTLNGLSVDIHLERNNNFNDIPLYMSRNGHVEKVFVAKEQTTAVYQSHEHGGSFLIMLDQGSNNVTRQKIFGTFHHNLSLYIIQPVEGAAVSPSADHVISRIPEQTLLFEHATPNVSTGELPYNASDARTFSHYGNNRTRRQAERYSVELFTVVDYKNYQFWYGLAPGSDKHSQAIQMIMQYMTYMVNAVDMRYKSIASENFVFDILSAGIYIADTAEAAPWSEDKQVNGKVDSSATLDAFTEWIQDQTNLPQFDHAMGFTGYDVASTSTSADSSGIAFTSALCTPQSTSVVEDRFSFLAMTTAAHELGHSLGAVHDGAGNTCNGNENYIMATVNSIRSDPVLGQHLWQFSTCTVQAFKSYIGQLDRSNSNCMLSTSSVSQRAITPKPMAEVYGPDDMCVKTFGQGSYVCRSVQNYDTMCTGMFCNSPGTTQCYSILPAEGTPCGKGKWCEKGRCVTSPSAPQNVADNCPIGDRPGLYDDSGKTCAELVAQNAGNCYSTYTSATCCASCNLVKTSDATCEYGDYNATYCPTMSRFGCYRNEQFCCKTCKERKNLTLPGCEFGDKFTGCLKSNCPLYDANNLAGCCETCADPAKTVQTSTSTTTTAKPTTTSTTTSTTSTTTSTTKSTTSSTTTSTTTTTTASTTKSSTSTTANTTTKSTTSGTLVPSNASTISTAITISSTIKITILPVTTSKLKTTSEPSTVITPTDTPKQEKVSELLVVAVGCGVGAVVVVVIIVIICVVIRRRKARLTAARGRKPSKDNTYDNIGFVPAISDKSKHPPPRRDGSMTQSNSLLNHPSTMDSLPHHPSTSANNVVFNGSTDYTDGYMLPKSTDESTLPRPHIHGVTYSAPNKPKKKPLVPPAKPPTKAFAAVKDITTDQSKRASKPVHYKRASNVSNASSTGSNDQIVSTLSKPQFLDANSNTLFDHNGTTFSNNGTTFSDPYDSIGDIEDVKLKTRRPTLPQNHPSRVRGNSKSADTKSSPKVKLEKSEDNFEFDNKGNKIDAPKKYNEKRKVLPDLPPLPQPRIKSAFNSGILSEDINNFVDVTHTYDEADAIPSALELTSISTTGKNAFSEKTHLPQVDASSKIVPVKPLPRRQNTNEFIDMHKNSDKDTMDDKQMSPHTVGLTKLPMKPLPRRDTSNDKSSLNKTLQGVNDGDEYENATESTTNWFEAQGKKNHYLDLSNFPDSDYLHTITAPAIKPLPRRKKSNESSQHSVLGHNNQAFNGDHMEMRI